MQWKVAPALAAGCTVVLKPSEMASLTCLEMAAIAHEVQLPPGVLNVVTGYGNEAGAPLRCVPRQPRDIMHGSSSSPLCHLVGFLIELVQDTAGT